MFIKIACQKLKIIEDLLLNKGDHMKRSSELEIVENRKKLNTNTYKEEPFVIIIYSSQPSELEGKEEETIFPDGSKIIIRVEKFRG